MDSHRSDMIGGTFILRPMAKVGTRKDNIEEEAGALQRTDVAAGAAAKAPRRRSIDAI